MLAENTPPIYTGYLDREIHLPSEAKLSLMDFIARELPHWRDHPDRPYRESETALTEQLADHLNSATSRSTDWSHVQFRCETSDEANPGRKIDLTAKPKAAVIFIEGRRHTQFDALFPIEAKRLPTPTGANRDKREYVLTNPGSTGGIQRFKLGHHGAKHDFAAMIGYVQEESFEHWHGEVNGWIHQLTSNQQPLWSDHDALEMLQNSSDHRICTLKSRHERINRLNPCELRHLWVQMK